VEKSYNIVILANVDRGAELSATSAGSDAHIRVAEPFPLPDYIAETDAIIVFADTDRPIVAQLDAVRKANNTALLYLLAESPLSKVHCIQYDVAEVLPSETPHEWLITSVIDRLDAETAWLPKGFLRRIVSTINNTYQYDVAIVEVLRQLRQIAPFDAINISMFEEQYSVVRYHHGYPPEVINAFANTRMPLALENLSQIIESGEAKIIDDTLQHKAWSTAPPHEWIRSWMGAPIKKNGAVIGLINMDAAQPHRFKQVHLHRVSAVMEHITLFLETAQLYDTLDDYTAILSVLNRQNNLLFATLSRFTTIDDLCRSIADTVVSSFGKTDCGVMLIDPEQEILVRYSRAGDYNVRADGVLPLTGKGLVAEAARTGEIVYSPDVDADERYVANEPQTRSELVIPLKTLSGVLGVLDLQSERPGAFSSRDQEALTSFANYAAMAIQNLRLFNEQRDYTQTLEEHVLTRTAELAAEKERVETILAYANDAILMLDAEGVIRKGNDAFEFMVRQSDSMYTGKLLADMLVETARSDVEDALQQMRETYKPQMLESQLYPMESVEPTALEIIFSPIVQHNGQINSIVCTLRDITRQKTIEAALRRTIDKEREANLLKTRFIKTVSHQFRTPLAAIMLSSELLRNYFDQLAEKVENEKSSRRIERHFSTIHDEIRRLETILDEVLYISTTTDGTEEFAPTSVDIQMIINTCIESVGKANPLHQFNLHVTGDNSQVYVDPAIFQRIIHQLLSNAATFGPDSHQVDVYLALRSTEIQIDVVDYGIGISPGEIEQLFQPFFRGQRGDTITGAGLGLTIVRHGVTVHGGSVSVTSDPQDGTRFRVTLPRGGT
jgi:PAS domain S-box-containing protein